MKTTRILALLIIAICHPIYSNAGKVSQETAIKAATTWSKHTNYPLQSNVKGAAQTVFTETGSGEQILFYIVKLNENGIVIVSSDDEITPVLAFSSSNDITELKQSGLIEIIRSDIEKLIESKTRRETSNDITGDIHNPQNEQTTENSKRNKQLWTVLTNDDSQTKSGTTNPFLDVFSDERVPKLLKTKWSQGNDRLVGFPLYNYFTPNHYPTGCVATAMGQIIRYHEKPIGPVTRNTYMIYVDNIPVPATIMGGDGQGGAYRWQLMDSEPSWFTAELNKKNISALLFDAGMSVRMQYTQNSSGALHPAAQEAFWKQFGYGSQYVSEATSNTGVPYDILMTSINASLDANLPAILGISSTKNGEHSRHSVVCDGYGYTSGVLFHHINLGWSTEAWYNIPNIDDYSNIFDMLFNITPGKWQFPYIISGRIVDSRGNPLQEVNVNIQLYNEPTITTTTNSNGIYSYVGDYIELKSISAEKNGYSFNHYFTYKFNGNGYTPNNYPQFNRWSYNFMDKSTINIFRIPNTALTQASVGKLNNHGDVVGYFNQLNRLPGLDVDIISYIYNTNTNSYKYFALPLKNTSPQQYVSTMATSVSDNGIIIGNYYGNGGISGFILQGNSWESITYPSSPYTFLVDVNGKGEIIGYAMNASNKKISFIYFNHSFKDFAPAGFETIVLEGFNDKGFAIGYIPDQSSSYIKKQCLCNISKNTCQYIDGIGNYAKLGDINDLNEICGVDSYGTWKYPIIITNGSIYGIGEDSNSSVLDATGINNTGRIAGTVYYFWPTDLFYTNPPGLIPRKKNSSSGIFNLLLNITPN